MKPIEEAVQARKAAVLKEELSDSFSSKVDFGICAWMIVQHSAATDDVLLVG